MQENTIAITGIGVLTPLGMELPQIFEALARQETRFAPISNENAPNGIVYAGNLPAEYSALEKSYYNKRTIKQTIRNTRLGCLCAHLAWQSAKLDLRSVPKERIGVILGTSGASIRDPEETIPTGAAKFKIIREMTNASSAWVSLDYGFTGPAFNLSAAGSSGLYAIIQACELINSGLIDIAIAGGSDISTTKMNLDYGLSHCIISRQYSQTHKLRPFDLRADGTLLSDGGAALILQSEKSAQDTKSNVFARIKGFAKSFDYNSVDHLEHSNHAYIQAMNNALIEAQCKDNIQLVCANSLTNINFDSQEALAIRDVFLPSNQKVYTTSFKPYTGYCIGGASAVDIALSAYALYTGSFPRLHSDIEQKGDHYIELYNDDINISSIKNVMVNSFSLAGHNCSCILGQ